MNQNNNRHPQQNARGRGALSNEVSRFDEQKREYFDDGWDLVETITPIKREIIIDNTKTIIARNTSPDINFNQSLNPYRGCEHGCIYCFARPTHAYLGYSPGLDFETKIHAKPNAAQLLRREFSKPSYQCQTLAIGTNTDPYQPIEKEQEITRQILETLLETRHPVSIVTKGTLILRDLDLLSALAKLNLVSVFISITTLNNKLHRQMEPRAMAPQKRLTTVEELRAHNIPVGVFAAPMIPRLNDMELEQILEASQKAGAQTAGYILIRLPLEISSLFREWLEEHYPDRAAKVMAHIQETHNGQDYNSNYFERHRGSGVYANLLKRRFEIAHNRLKFAQKLPELRKDLFRKPSADPRQMELF